MYTPSTVSVKLVRDDVRKKVEVLVDGQLFTAYIYPDRIMKPVLYPVVTAGGHRVTRGFPLDRVAGERVDHPHHIGIWLNYGNVNGLDFWNHSEAIPTDQKHKFGTIRHRAIVDAHEEGPTAFLAVAADWLRPDGSLLIAERTEFRFSATATDRIIDRSTTLTAVAGDILFKDDKEGMIAIRVARGLEHPSSRPEIFTDAEGRPTAVPVLNNDGVTGCYFSSEGPEGDDVWGTRGRWMNLAGRLGGEEVSVIMIDHPSNPGYPTYWHARGYGLYAANPLGQAAMSGGKDVLNFALKQGASVSFQYRFVIHSGARPGNADIASRYAGFGSFTPSV
jgi:hypothetical protein